MAADEKKHRSRELLLEAAKGLFAAKGYEAVSTRELAERAGVNLGAIQYHFGSKAKLFVATVYDLMQEGSCHSVAAAVQGELATREEAATGLCQFIRAFLQYQLRSEGVSPCRLMVREILAASDPELNQALMAATREQFMEPIASTLFRVLHALAPESSQEELEFTARSIVGQCTFYLTHGPFLQGIHGIDFATEPHLTQAARFIMTFSLRAVRFEEGQIQTTINQVLSDE